ncbi:unnamed protein product [Ectocarpus sp. CCAP 1310/34]|nr:unnamed protein product [Ectocarpus sp. CCAP 1310/34]
MWLPSRGKNYSRVFAAYATYFSGDHIAARSAAVSDAVRWCGRCYQKRLDGMKRYEKQPEHPANTDHGSGREAPTPLEPLDTVRAMVVEVLCRGDFLYWQDVANCLAAGRAKVCMD